jgi:hypothetical protein
MQYQNLARIVATLANAGGLAIKCQPGGHCHGAAWSPPQLTRGAALGRESEKAEPNPRWRGNERYRVVRAVKRVCNRPQCACNHLAKAPARPKA